MDYWSFQTLFYIYVFRLEFDFVSVVLLALRKLDIG